MTTANLQIDKDFVQQLTAFQRRLYVYIFTILANQQATDEVLSDTNATLWEKRQEFQSGTNFSAWALKVAYFRILSYQKKQRLDRHRFSDEFLSGVAEQALQVSESADQREKALFCCMKKLSDAERRLIKQRYHFGLPIHDIAARQHKTPNAVSQLLSRIRIALADCIEHTLQSEVTT